MNPNALTFPIVIVLIAILIITLSIRRLRTLQRAPHAKWRRIDLAKTRHKRWYRKAPQEGHTAA